MKFCSKEDIKAYCDDIKQNVKSNIELYSKDGCGVPRFTIYQIGDNPASNKYVANKMKDCQECGIDVRLKKFDADIDNPEIVADVLYQDKSDAIIIQLPVPKKMEHSIPFFIKMIGENRDIDGMHPMSKYQPATPSGIINYIESRKGKEWFDGKKAVVIGRSDIVGKPIAKMLLERNCTVTVCHSKTKDLKEYTRNADLIIVSAGKMNLITEEHIDMEHQPVIFDVGINFDENGKMCGDVNKELSQKLDYCTPVPFGVGQLTKAQVVQSVLESFEKYNTSVMCYKVMKEM